MRLLQKIIHPSLTNISGNVFARKAVRAVVLDGEEILLLYTKRYNDFSFPGGGVSDDEDYACALKRELIEETGAQNIEILEEYGYVDEYRPHYKTEFDLIHMLSFFYLCKVDKDLGLTKMEHYEVTNGMEARWINIHEAIKHNRRVMESKEASMGLSVERETIVLEMVVRELLHKG